MAYNPFREMEELRREIDRTFDQYWGGRNPRRRVAFLPGAGARQYPLVNLNEDKENYYVEALAPGIDPASLELSVDGQTLTLSGEKKGPEGVAAEAYHRSERSAGKFTRRVDLGATVEVDNVRADYRNGLIVVTVPKAPAAKPRQIPISAQ